MKKEESLQIAVCNYLKFQYPDVYFTAESSGVKLTIGQAVKAKKQRNPSKGLPDLIILEPNKNFHGLCFEFKVKSPLLKNGQLSSNKHIQEQAAVLNKLSDKRYLCSFVWSFEQAKSIIDKYMKNR